MFASTTINYNIQFVDHLSSYQFFMAINKSLLNIFAINLFFPPIAAHFLEYIWEIKVFGSEFINIFKIQFTECKIVSRKFVNTHFL